MEVVGAMTPLRIQRKRTRGWKMPVGAVYVGRPSKWGNPMKDTHSSREHLTAQFRRMFIGLKFRDIAKDYPKSWVVRRELRGKDLACWCPLCTVHEAGKPFGVDCGDCSPCHADPLGEIANG